LSVPRRDLKKTSAAFRASNGVKITAEHRRGVDPESIHAALVEMIAQLGLRGEHRGEAA
jgi:hypothetical protein